MEQDTAVAEKPAEKLTKLTYMPLPGDTDPAVVNGITFPAYVPVDLDEVQATRVAHLVDNMWFSTGEIDAKRKESWDRLVQAKKDSEEKHRLAGKAEAEHRRASAPVLRRPDPIGYVEPTKEGPKPITIAPTIGRVVWYWRPYNPNLPPMADEQPNAAIVAFVHDDRTVNLNVINHDGAGFSAKNVQLLQGDDVRPRGGFCEWMPFQKGQAAKAEPEVTKPDPESDKPYAFLKSAP